MRKSNWFGVLFLSLFVTFFSVSSQAAGPTKVQGVIGQNTTWTLADSPIIITNKTLVPDGVTLTIDPGVEVKFDGFFTLQIEGVLDAQGTKNQTIKFTSNLMNPKAGDWDSIYFVGGFGKNGTVVDQDDNYVSGSIISYAEVSFGAAIQVGYNAYISNNFIHDMKGATIQGWGGQTGVITIGRESWPNYFVKNNVISHNGGSGVYSALNMGTGRIKIIGNTFQRNKANQGGGVNCSADSRCILQDNIILQNEAGVGGGIYAQTAPKINHNIIANNCTTSELKANAGNVQDAANGSAIVGGTDLSNNIFSSVSYNSIEGNFSSAKGSSASILIFDIKGWNHNNIFNATTYEFYADRDNRGAHYDATNNFFGTTNQNDVAAKIWDANDDFDLPTIDFLPILQQPEPAAPKLDPKMLEPMACGCGVANTDTDGDSFADCNDQCPNDKNKQVPGQCGCGKADTDADQDGVADCNDKCPNTTKGVKVDATGCPPDSDGDGFPDYIDQCPNDKNKLLPGQCGCGVADVDTDKDGVLDCKDKCANTPANTKVDGTGCPVNPAPVCNLDVKASQKVQGGYDLFWSAKFANLVVVNGTNVNGSYVVFAADSRNQPFNADPNQRPASGEENDINHNDIHYVNPTTYNLTASGPGGTCQQSADVPPSQQQQPMRISPKTLNPPPLRDWWRKPALPQPPSQKSIKSKGTGTETVQPVRKETTVVPLKKGTTGTPVLQDSTLSR